MVSVSKIETEGYVRTKLPGPVQVPLHRAGEAQFPVPLTFRGEKEQLASDLQRAHGTAWPTSVANEEPSILTWERILLPRKTNRAQRSPGTCSHLGIQVVGIERNGGTRGLAATYDRLDAGDQLLVLGTQKQITDTAFWLAK